MTLPWWGWVALVGAFLAVAGYVAAPFVGATLARRDVPLSGGRPSVAWVRVRAAYWRWVRGRRSP